MKIFSSQINSSSQTNARYAIQQSVRYFICKICYSGLHRNFIHGICCGGCILAPIPALKTKPPLLDLADVYNKCIYFVGDCFTGIYDVSSRIMRSLKLSASMQAASLLAPQYREDEKTVNRWPPCWTWNYLFTAISIIYSLKITKI